MVCFGGGHQYAGPEPREALEDAVASLERVTAERAKRINLVNSVLPDAGFHAKAFEYAAAIAAGSVSRVATTLRCCGLLAFWTAAAGQSAGSPLRKAAAMAAACCTPM